MSETLFLVYDVVREENKGPINGHLEIHILGVCISPALVGGSSACMHFLSSMTLRSFTIEKEVRITIICKN